MSPLREVFRSMLSMVYPPLCLYCTEALSDDSAIFCHACLKQLEMIDPAERCPRCFSPNYSIESHYCADCQKNPSVFTCTAAAFDYIGPAGCLVRSMKYGSQPYLAKGGGAFMTSQFLRLDWPIPDVIVPVPIAFNRWIDRGYNQSHLLADSFAEFINRPLQDVLKRKSGDYSQAGLSRRQRMQLRGNAFILKKGISLQDRCVLLVDDVMTTGSTMRCCAEAILEQAPSAIYGLTLCRAIK